MLTVACQNDEFLLAIQIVCDELGIGGDNLLFGCKGEVLLELEIAQSARESEITCLSDIPLK